LFTNTVRLKGKLSTRRDVNQNSSARHIEASVTQVKDQYYCPE
jgi:hypothetical protein